MIRQRRADKLKPISLKTSPSDLPNATTSPIESEADLESAHRLNSYQTVRRTPRDHISTQEAPQRIITTLEEEKASSEQIWEAALMKTSCETAKLRRRQFFIIKVWALFHYSVMAIFSLNASTTFSDWTFPVRILLAVRVLVMLPLGWLLFQITCRGRHEYLFPYLLLTNYLLMGSTFLIGLNRKYLIGTETEAILKVVRNLEFFQPACYLLQLQVLFITLEILTSKQQRRFFFTSIWAFYLLFIITPPVLEVFQGEEGGTSRAFIIGSTVLFVLIASGLQWVFFKISSIRYEITSIQQEETQKHLEMFNALRDGIILIKDSGLVFINSVARKLFSAPGDKCYHPATTKKFFVYSQQQNSETSSSSSSEAKFSIRDLLRSSFPDQTIFTTSEEISSCSSMDQVSKVIERLKPRCGAEEATSEPLFVQINFIRVNKERSTDSLDSQGDEVMVQIQDISHRILGQSLEIERQYLTIMNSTVSHEMRNPLNALLSSVEVQERLVEDLEAQGGPQDLLEEIRKNLSVAQSSGKLLKFNVEDILAMPQLQQGKFTKNITRVSLDRSVREITSILDYQTKSKGISVSSEFVALGNTGEGSFSVLIDEQRFQQILLNFLSNAAKFTHKGGQIKAVVYLIRPDDSAQQDACCSFFQYPGWPSLAGDTEGFVASQAETVRRMLSPGQASKVVLSVMDSGVGIKPADQAKLFKLFGCLQATRKINTRGVGLGLAISKMIAEEFGGEVAVLSEHGRGSAFYASFECQEDKTHEKNKSNLDLKLEAIKQRQLSKARANSQKMMKSGKELAEGQRVLIVDDEAYNCEMLKAIIQGLGFENGKERLDLCLSGSEALEKLKEREYSLVLTDLSMPEMDGFELGRRLKQLFKDSTKRPKIVAVTGHTESEYLEEAWACGIDQLYSKPLSSDSISLLLTECGFKVKLKPQVMQRLGLS